MKISYEKVLCREHIVIWGTGRIMRQCIDRLDPALKIKGFCDTFEKNWGACPAKKLLCQSKDLLTATDTVLIAIEAQEDIDKVSKEMDEKGIDYCHIYEAVEGYKREWEKSELIKYHQKWDKVEEPDGAGVIRKYISCHIPYQNCNLQCSYCYIRQVRNFKQNTTQFHSPEYIRAALSRKRIGGTALINFCAGGETLMHPEIVPIIAEIVREGHYVTIVTNGTITAAFKKFLDMGIDMTHCFFKFSYHFVQLKQRNLLKVFFDNVNLMRKAGASITVEAVASDDLVPYIDEMKEWALKEVGALPQLTLPRDDRKDNIDLITGMTMEEYKKIWSEFDSELFRFKLDILYRKRTEKCMAGDWSLQIDLETGIVYQCVGHPQILNVYEDMTQPIRVEAVGCSCRLPYCYNGHVYLTLGDIEEVEAPTYYEVRDRKLADGSHWLTEEMRKIFSQKLYENNKDE
jgi:organic radical activating enzyme